MINLFQTDDKDEAKVYNIHLDQLADKEYADFINRIDYIEEGPVPITRNPGMATTE